MKSWFITGASSGLGLSMTRKLLERGDLVHATVRRTDAMQDLAQRNGDRLKIIELELTDTRSLRQEVDRAFANGRIDIVVRSEEHTSELQSH